jgi:AcrR family transcriptional regulator
MPDDALSAARRHDRPRRHEGRSDTETAIFAATERLLEQVPLHEISVADILQESGVSRATFYFYFSSKYAVVTGLLARLYDEMFELVVGRDEGESPQAALRRQLRNAAALWSAHRLALRAVHEHWPESPELRAAWMEIFERFTTATATLIDQDRKAGLARPGPDSRQLASSLLWASDRCMYIAGLGVDRDLPAEQDTVDPLLAVWIGSVYGSAGGEGKPARRTRSSRR